MTFPGVCKCGGPGSPSWAVPPGTGLPLGKAGGGAIGGIAGIGVLLSQDQTGDTPDHPWSDIFNGGGTAQPPDDDDPEADAHARRIAEHAERSALRPDGSGTHYVSGVRPDQLHVYVGDVLKGKVPNIETRYLRDGRVGHWDPERKAVVIEDGLGGTVHTPTNGYEYFKMLR